MFTVFYSFNFRIPAISAIAAAVALLRGRARRAFCYYLRAVGPGSRRRLVNHWRRKPNHQGIRLAGQMVLDPRFTRWHPVLGAWR